LRYGLLGRRLPQAVKSVVEFMILACGHRAAYYLSIAALHVVPVSLVAVVHHLVVVAVHT
jgi:hypothetical protein